MPEIFFASLDLVPDEFKDIAKNGDDGKVSINVVSNAKLIEFRDNNVKLAGERDTFKKKAETLESLVGADKTPEEIATELTELRNTAQLVKDGKLKTDDKVAAEVETRVTTMKTDYETRLQAVGKEVIAWKDKALQSDSKFKRSQIAQAITNAVIAPESGVESSALPDILERAYKVYHVEDDGALIAKEGEATIYGGDGSTPLTPKEWIGKLKDTAPYFFKNSTGGGSQGNGNGKGLGGLSQEAFNKLPPQKRLELAHTQKAS